MPRSCCNGGWQAELRHPGVGVPSLRHELDRTRTARWYQAARSAPRAGAWDERARCFAALAAILAERAAPGPVGERRGQPVIELPGILTRVAARPLGGGAEPVSRRWRASADGRSVGRWAGPDPAVRPGAAFLAEAKIVSFWPYREGVLEVADAFDLTRTELATAYLRALGAWAGDERLLAACHPAGAPGCVPEDMAVLAARPSVLADGGNEGGNEGERPADSPAARAARLAELAGSVVTSVLADISITPLGAVNAVREEMFSLLAEPADPIADRVTRTAAELADRILHGADDEPPLTPGDAGRMLVTLRGLVFALAGLAEPARAGTPEAGR
jgi:hypothetical protein